MTLLNSGQWGPGCTFTHDVYWKAADVICARCGADICSEHAYVCTFCQYLKKIPWYCPGCAGSHEMTRLYPLGCKAEWENEWYLQTEGKPRERNFEGMQQRAAERQRKREIYPDHEDYPK